MVTTDNGNAATGASESAGRYFFAVWPEAQVQEAMFDWARSVQADAPARQVAGDNLHITLAFLGELAPPQVSAARRVGAETHWNGAALALDRIGYWKRSRIVWAGSREGCASLSALAEDLRGRLRRLGFEIEERPFVPHVTLYRKAHRKPRWRRRQVEWRIDEFCLVESHLAADGARYSVVDRWSAKGDMK